MLQKIQLLVGLGGLEPPTSPLSGVRSNQTELQTQKMDYAFYNSSVFMTMNLF